MTIKRVFGYGARRGGRLVRARCVRKQRVIEYIGNTVRQRGYPPSVREIAEAVGLASTSAIHRHLEALEREGLLERGATHSRAIRLTPAAQLRSGGFGTAMAQIAAAANTLPVIGEIAAGSPIEAYRRPARRFPCRKRSRRKLTPTC